MVTSLMFWSTNSSSMDTTGGREREIKSFEDHQEMKVDTGSTKPRGRKNSKSGQKKLPQRGLGVAQLERLRVQETLKKMPEFDQVHHHQHASDQINNYQHHHHFQNNQNHQFQFPFLDHHHQQQQQQQLQLQQNNVSVPFPRFSQLNNFGTTPITNVSAQPINSQPFVFPHYKYENGGYSGGSGVRPVFSDHMEVDRLRIGHEPRLQNENPFELSSNPKTHCFSDQCDICLKKKRIINGENLGFEGVKTRYTENKQVDGPDFLQLDLGRNWTIDQGEINKDLGSNGVRRANFPGVNDEGVEVLAVHRKGKSVGGNVLMEYEFFPGKGSNNNWNSKSSNSWIKESLMAESAKNAGGGETSQSNTNFLDLSLKLSC